MSFTQPFLDPLAEHIEQLTGADMQYFGKGVPVRDRHHRLRAVYSITVISQGPFLLS